MQWANGPVQVGAGGLKRGWVDSVLSLHCLPQGLPGSAMADGNLAKWWNIEIHVNPTHVSDHQPHPVELRQKEALHL